MARVSGYVRPGETIAVIDGATRRLGKVRSKAIAENRRRVDAATARSARLLALSWRSSPTSTTTSAVEAYPSTAHDLPDPGQVYADLRHLTLLCPECSA